VKQIIAVGGDPGGAAALEPVLRVLQNRAAQRLRVLAYRQAVDIWVKSGITVEPLPDSEQVDPAAWIGANGVNLILTATSVNGVDHERSFIRWAGAASVPSVAVLDFWTNYAARFRDAGDSGLVLPSVVGVMDERARHEMVSVGFPTERLVVTGQPAFDSIGAFRAGWTDAKRREVREQFSSAPGCRIVLFLSQPLSQEMTNLACNIGAPIDEREVLLAVASALEGVTSSADLDILLAVRPHPRERLRQEDLPFGRRVRAVIARGGDAWSTVLACDLVVGMTTALLVQASLLGCVVLSVQPGAEESDPVVTNRSGGSVAVYDLDNLPGALRACLLDEEYRSRLREAGLRASATDATANVIGLIDRTLGKGESRT
jgi:hypothetical protein